MATYIGADGQTYDWDTGNPVAAAPSWWEQTLGTVITAAANKKFSSLQPGVQYQVDANGNPVPMGVAHTSSSVVPASNPLVILALVAIAGLVIYKLVK